MPSFSVIMSVSNKTNSFGIQEMIVLLASGAVIFYHTDNTGESGILRGAQAKKNYLGNLGGTELAVGYLCRSDRDGFRESGPGSSGMY